MMTHHGYVTRKAGPKREKSGLALPMSVHIRLVHFFQGLFLRAPFGARLTPLEAILVK